MAQSFRKGDTMVQTAATAQKTLGSGTPAVQQGMPQRIVVGERSELPLSPLAFVDNTLSAPVNLVQAGLLRRLRLLLNGILTITVGAGTIAWAPKGIWNLFGYPFLGTDANAPIVDASSYMQYIINRARKFGYDPTNIYLANGSVDTALYNLPTLAAGANNVAAFLDMFVELDQSSFIGLLNLQQVGQSRVQLTMKNFGTAGGSGLNAGGPNTAVTWGTPNAGNAATFAGALNIQQLSYDIPLLNAKAGDTLPPENMIHRYRTKRQVIGAAGDTTVTLDAGPVYTRLYIRVQLNGVDDTNDVTTIKYQYGLGKVQINRPLAHQLAYQRDLFGQDFPTGIFILDFGPSDVIRSSDVAAPQVVVTISNSAVLGANNNILEVVSEEIIQLPA